MAQTVTLKMKGAALSDVLTAIENQTDFSFFYNSTEIDPASVVSVNVVQATIQEVMRQVLPQADCRLEGDKVILTLRQSVPEDSVVVYRGRVCDSNGIPLPDAAVILSVGRKMYHVLSGADGRFVLSAGPAIEPSARLTVGYLGFKTFQAEVGRRTMFEIVLEEEQDLLSESVVVGYGTQRRADLTGSVSTVSASQLAHRTATSLSTMLQGVVPGLNVTTFSGDPSATGSLNIRGFTSINEAGPLVLIDGAIGDIDRVNPADVESVSVIKDAAAAAVYGARAAFGVILVTTRHGEVGDEETSVQVHYGGRLGFGMPTTSTDYETTGYWSVYVNNLFWNSYNGGQYIRYDDADMMALLSRVGDKTENSERPWVVVDPSTGKYKYYANTDWYHALYNDVHPLRQHQVSVSGGSNSVRFYLSGVYDRQEGIIKARPDVLTRYNFRSKLDVTLNRYMSLSNNTSFYRSLYDYPGLPDINESMQQAGRHALACFPLQNPDGTWTYRNPYINYAVANGRHIILGSDDNVNKQLSKDFSTTTALTITPTSWFSLKADVTWRTASDHNTYRRTEIDYSDTPGVVTHFSNTSAFEDRMDEHVYSTQWLSGNIFGTFDKSFRGGHNLTAVGGFNLEQMYRKRVAFQGKHLQTTELSDLSLVGPNSDGVVETQVRTERTDQTEYALAGFFFRASYDFQGRYLIEMAGRYDGTSRFASGHRWGLFPSVSAGWRISEEPFFAPLRQIFDHVKLRASFGSLGNQVVPEYQWLRSIDIVNNTVWFGEGTTLAKTANLGKPNAGDLTWEVSKHYNLGVDVTAFSGRLDFTGEAFIRDTEGMLTSGIALPAVYGADSPNMNAADLRTRGLELSIGWKDGFMMAGSQFRYGLRATLADSRTRITRFDNPDKSFVKGWYEGMEVGEIWGFEVDGLFASDAEAADYTSRVDQSYVGTRITGGWQGGDIRYVDRNSDGIINEGGGTVDDPGDMKILGNSRVRLRYGLSADIEWKGFDISIFLEGTGNHYWYPSTEYQPFWGPYGRPYVTFLPKNFMDNVWSEDNTDAYFPRARGYIAQQKSSELGTVNSRYLQNLRYLRLKNLTVGYTIPAKVTGRAGLDKVRIYFSGENLACWSPLKKITKYIDPEGAYNRELNRDMVTSDSSSGSVAQLQGNESDNGYYPWQKTLIFGIDLIF